MSEEKINNLKQIVENPKDMNELFAVIYEMFDNQDMTEEEICEVLNSMHLPDEIKEQIIEEESLLKK